jgi:hypothetical protein
MTKDTRGRWGGIAVAIVLLTAAGCRQPDGPMPTPQGEQPNKVEDIGRDLQNLAAEDANAPAELAEDLSSLDPVPRPADQMQELLQGLAAALAGQMLSDDAAQRIANLLFVAMSARELSGPQIAMVAADLRTTLVEVGAPAPAADRASAAASAVATDVTRNRKRWYHR